MIDLLVFSKDRAFQLHTLLESLQTHVSGVNNIFVQFDLNGAEIRTLLALTSGDHPKEDVHEFHMKNIYLFKTQ